MNILKLRSTILSITFLFLVVPFINAQSPDNQQQKKPLVIRKSTGVFQTSSLRQVLPEYPQEAKSQGISGEVIIEVQVDTDGGVISTKPVSGNQILSTL